MLSTSLQYFFNLYGRLRTKYFCLYWDSNLMEVETLSELLLHYKYMEFNQVFRDWKCELEGEVLNFEYVNEILVNKVF